MARGFRMTDFFLYRSSTDQNGHLVPPSPNAVTSPASEVTDPSPIAPSSTGTEFADVDGEEEEQVGVSKETTVIAPKSATGLKSPDLTVLLPTSPCVCSLCLLRGARLRLPRSKRLLSLGGLTRMNHLNL